MFQGYYKPMSSTPHTQLCSPALTEAEAGAILLGTITALDTRIDYAGIFELRPTITFDSEEDLREYVRTHRIS